MPKQYRPHLAIDARAYSWTGIGRYTRNILRHVTELLPGWHITAVILPSDVAIFSADQEQFSTNASVTTITVDSHPYSVAEQTRLPRQLKCLSADLYHFTHFNVPILFSRPYLVTVHDTTRFIFPGQKHRTLVRQFSYEHIFNQAVARAQRVIAVSQSTAHDIIQYGAPRDAVEVMYEGVEERFFEAPTSLQRTKVKMHLGTDDPYLLYVGVWMSHKNLIRLLRAFLVVKRHHPNVRLVLTGKPVPQYAKVMHSVRGLNLDEDIIFAGHVPDELLPALYAGSKSLVFPSLYEGFGLPVLEAAAAGAPVIASNVTSLPELLRNTAILVNPEDEQELAAAMIRILNEPELAQELSRAGRLNARRYGWPAAAAKHAQLYKKIVEQVGATAV